MAEIVVRTSRFHRRVVAVLLFGYAAFVLVITLSPRMPGTGTVGKLVNSVLDVLHSRGLFLNVDYFVVEFLGNILMFVPLGFLAGLLLSRKWWPALLIAGTLYSACIELCQLAFLPDRYPDFRDVISNSIGFLLGAGVAVFIRLVVAHRDERVERDRQQVELQSSSRY